MDKYVDLVDYLKRETRDDFYLGLKEIEEIIEEQMNAHRIIDNPSLEDLLYVHDATFKAVEKYIKEDK